MNFWNGLGVLGVILLIALVVISIWFCIVTATFIATALGAVGWNWWIIAITLFSSLGGTTGGALINIGRS